MAGRMVVESLEEKVMEAVERTRHLVELAPGGRLEWRPSVERDATKTTDLGHLLGHLLTCIAGFCAALYAAFPEKLGDLLELRALKVDHFCSPEEAKERISVYAAAIRKGFGCCSDEDLGRKVRTVFVPEGETLMTLLLGNMEHLTNHKFQLFLYLKMMGIPVATPDLYQLRRGAAK